MRITTFLLLFIITGSTAVFSQDTAATEQNAISQTDLVGTSYTMCMPNENPVYQAGQAETCFEYHLRENGQTIRMFWIDRLDTGAIENKSITHHAWILDDNYVIIQGEHMRYGQDSIFYYDVHEISENGDLAWIRREVDQDGSTEAQDLTDIERVLTKGEPKGPEKFRAQMERDSRFSQPVATEWDPEAYWDEIVDEYPANYLRGS